ncbi:MAG: putative peptide maturation dehydrogenase [Dokdonella sp.]
MSPSMRVRRCTVLLIEPSERLDLDLVGLFNGGCALKATLRWLALAPHLDEKVEVDDDEIIALRQVGERDWRRVDELMQTMPAAVLERLLAKGLLIGDAPEHGVCCARDELVRNAHWTPLAAVAHYFSRWTNADVADDVHITRNRSLSDLITEYGLPPSHLVERVPAAERIGLPPPRESALDALFRQRATCRNFDTQAVLASTDFSDLLKRIFGCHAVAELMPGVHALKKSYPSGGSMHPLEAYLLVRRVEGLAPGLYHYHVVDHALEPLSMLDTEAAGELSQRFVAGQDYLADAPVLVALVARFGRTFWKYRNHPKAYRTIVLEAGHVSQNLYLAATEAGFGAFITAAINEVDIEQAFALDSLQEGPIAVCGFGARAAQQATIEFDPLRSIWDEHGRLNVSR